MRRLGQVSIVLALALSALVVPSLSSSAATCPAGKVCVFSGVFDGFQLNVPGRLGISNKIAHSAMEDHVRSVMNGSKHAVKLFDEPDAKGAEIACVSSFQSVDIGSQTDTSSTKVLKREVC